MVVLLYSGNKVEAARFSPCSCARQGWICTNAGGFVLPAFLFD